MKKRNLLFNIFLMIAFLSLCSLYVSQVNTNAGYDEKQKDIVPNILSTPKSSSYDVTEKWNYTTSFEVSSVAVSADGRFVAVGVEDIILRGGDPSHSIFFFNTSDHDGIPLWSYDLNVPIDSLAISADGRYIVAISKSADDAYLFNSTVPEPGENKMPVWKVDWTNKFCELYSVDMSADGKYIVLGGMGAFGVIELYNNSYASRFGSKNLEYLWYYNTNFNVNDVAISADGKYVTAGTEYFPIRDVDHRDQIFFLNNTDYVFREFNIPMWSFDAGCSIDSIAISAFGEYIVAGSYSGEMVYLFNSTVPEPGEDKHEIWSVDFDIFGLGELYSFDISADGKYIVLGGGIHTGPGLVRLYDNSYASSGFDKSNEYLWYYEPTYFVHSVAISADGEYVAAGTEILINKDSIFLFNNTDYEVGDDHEPTWSFTTTDNDINSVSMSAWGNYIAAGGGDGVNGRAYLFYHARPIPRIFYGNGGGDDDDEEEGAIPFGNTYLLFAAITVASLVIITKRKAIFSKH